MGWIMELREMRVFIGVVEGGSFSAAGRQLGVSQSALSQTISSLERRLEVRLLERTRSGVHPTDAGHVLLAEARAVLDRHDRALTALARKVGGYEEVLRLGLALELPPDLLGKPFAVLEEAFPGTRVTVRHLPQAEQESALRTGGLDVGLLRGRPSGDQLDCLLVQEEPLGVLLAERDAARLAGPDGVSLEALAGLEWIGFPRREAPGFHDEIAAVLRNHGLAVGDPQPDDRVLIPEVRFTEVAAGHAFSLAPGWLAGQAPGSLAWRPVVGSPIVRRTWAVWAAASHRRDVGHFIAAFDVPERACAWSALPGPVETPAEPARRPSIRVGAYPRSGT
jgi:DNA-binding transcriptional LysR family regulator